MAKTKKKFDIYEVVTQKIIDSLKEGKIPWRKSWSGGESSMAQNFITKKPYRGVNTFLLGMLPYESPYFMTFKQAVSKGAMVKKGEKGHMVVFWKIMKFEDKKTKLEKVIPLLKYFTVFNIEQIEGLKLPTPKKGEKKPIFNKIEEAEKILAGYKNSPPVKHGGSRAFYTPALDTVTMPQKETFSSEESYYGVLFHELGHSTGHTSRLNRDFGGNFDNHKYSKEELVAELTSAFLAAKSGIDNSDTSLIDNNKAYIQSWLSKLESDPKWVIEASSKARKAADHILDEEYVAVKPKEQKVA